jgi:hypothetical protein
MSTALGVILQGLLEQRCQIDQLQQFGHRAADLEARVGCAIAFAGFGPFAVMICHNVGYRLRADRVSRLLNLSSGSSTKLVFHGSSGVNRAFRADEQIAPLVLRVAEHQVGRRQARGVHGQLHRRQFTSRRQFNRAPSSSADSLLRRVPRAKLRRESRRVLPPHPWAGATTVPASARET